MAQKAWALLSKALFMLAFVQFSKFLMLWEGGWEWTGPSVAIDLRYLTSTPTPHTNGHCLHILNVKHQLDVYAFS